MAVADRVIMLENSIYSVAAPEAAASIVWRDSSRKVEAAEQLQITSRDLSAMGVVEEVVPEPEGGAHLDFNATACALEGALRRHLEAVARLPVSEMLEHRYERYRYIDSLIRAEPEFGPKVESRTGP
jgi:acetyl-CoA carboxylase carboxyl transferase subunit alpha